MQREVFIEGMDHPQYAETFTIPEAAKALGKTELTLRKWIADDMLPAPVLKETQRNYAVYSSGELQIIARVLVEHEREFAYYRFDHSSTIERMHQAMHGYRAQHI